MRISDWSSDVCSSDLPRAEPGAVEAEAMEPPGVAQLAGRPAGPFADPASARPAREGVRRDEHRLAKSPGTREEWPFAQDRQAEHDLDSGGMDGGCVHDMALAKELYDDRLVDPLDRSVRLRCGAAGCDLGLLQSYAPATACQSLVSA